MLPPTGFQATYDSTITLTSCSGPSLSCKRVCMSSTQHRVEHMTLCSSHCSMDFFDGVKDMNDCSQDCILHCFAFVQKWDDIATHSH